MIPKSKQFNSGSHQLICHAENKIVTMQFSIHVSLEDALLHISEYLRACGYCLDRLQSIDADEVIESDYRRDMMNEFQLDNVRLSVNNEEKIQNMKINVIN